MYIAARSMDDPGTLSAVTFLLRNNAVYELLPFMLLLIFCIPRGVRKRMACAACGGHDAGDLMVDCIECIISQQEQRRRL